MIQGKILKGIAGFYYVYTEEGIYQCRARGLFRKEAKKPLAGDDVMMELTDTQDVEGNVVEILPRRNCLVRPPVANIDQALVIFAGHSPEPAFGLLDRFLVLMGHYGIASVICFNKDDLLTGEEEDRIRGIYRDSGSRILFTSAETGEGLQELARVLEGQTTAVAGPSGVGKSSLINRLLGREAMETGEISRKVKRGKQTTRHTELLPIGEDTFIFDSPGFSSLDLPDIPKEELRFYYPEFEPYGGGCRFHACTHLHEPDCRVKEAVEDGRISRERYDSYGSVYMELEQKRSY